MTRPPAPNPRHSISMPNLYPSLNFHLALIIIQTPNCHLIILTSKYLHKHLIFVTKNTVLWCRHTHTQCFMCFDTMSCRCVRSLASNPCPFLIWPLVCLTTNIIINPKIQTPAMCPQKVLLQKCPCKYSYTRNIQTRFFFLSFAETSCQCYTITKPTLIFSELSSNSKSKPSRELQNTPKVSRLSLKMYLYKHVLTSIPIPETYKHSYLNVKFYLCE